MIYNFHMANEIQHIVNIPLSKIVPRKENQYPLTDIVRLKESIRKNGVLQPVILRRSGDTYTLIAGERRYTAARELYQAAFVAQDGNEMRRFVEIPAIVFEDIDNQTDEEIYRATNDFTRQMSTFQKIVFLKPEKIDMSEPYWKQEYVSKVLGEKKLVSWQAGLLDVKGTKHERSKLVHAMLMELDPNCDASEKTVRNYLAFLDRSSDELKDAVITGKISIRDALAISWNDDEEQKDAVASVTEPVYSDYIEEGTVLSGAPARKQARAASKVSRKLRSYESRLKKISSDFSKLIDGVSDIDSLSSEDQEIINKIQEISALFTPSKEDSK